MWIEEADLSLHWGMSFCCLYHSSDGSCHEKRDLSVVCLTSNGPGHAKTHLMPFANNKGADQPAHPRSLISTFIVHYLNSTICILATSKKFHDSS